MPTATAGWLQLARRAEANFHAAEALEALDLSGRSIDIALAILSMAISLAEPAQLLRHLNS